MQQADIALLNASVVQLSLKSSQVKAMRRVGEDLIVVTQSGETLTIRAFFKSFIQGVQNDLVLEDDKGGLWLTNLSGGQGELTVGYSPIDSVEPLLLHDSDTGGILPWLIGGIGALVAGAAFGGGGSGSGGSAADTTPPAAPAFDVTSDAAGRAVVSGRAEAGSTVSVRFPDGSSTRVTAGSDGSFTVVSAKPQPGGTITAQATDAAGNAGPTTTVSFSDTTGPVAPVLHVAANPDGSITVTGTAEPGSTVQIRNPDGTTTTVVAGADGSFTVTSPAGQPSGTVTAVATDAVGNVGGTATVTYTETTPPNAPTVNPTDGSPITGTAEPGAVVTIKDNTGTVIGSATTQPDGTYTVTPTTPPADGTVLTVVATDPSGNPSTPTTITVDSTPPGTPTVNPTDGSPITGTAEPGAVVTIKDNTGTVIGSATTQPDGTYTVTPTTPPADGTVLTVVATDPSGNPSTPTTITVDSTPPGTPTVNPTDGSPITGTAEPGAVVTIKDNTGTVIGSATTQPDGTYTVTPTTPPADGTVLTVVATDPSGNTSNPTTIAVDSTAPVISIAIATDGNDDGVINATEKGVDVTVKVTLVSGATVGDVINVTDGTATATATLSATDVASGYVNFSFANPVEGATLAVSATSTDLAGNVSAPAATDSATVQTLGTSSLSPTNAVVITSDANDDGFINAAETGATSAVRVNLQQAAAGDVVSVTDGTTTKTIVVSAADVTAGFVTTSFTTPAEGRVLTVSAFITDATGNNSATATDSARIDTTSSTALPTVSILLDANDDGTISIAEKGMATTTSLTVGVSAAAVAGDVITVKNGGTTVATLVVGTDIAIGGTATVNNVTLPADGELLTVTAEIADAVGNPGASASDTATIDLTGPAATALPTVSILLDANDDGTISIAEKGMATTTSLTVGVSAAAVAGDVITVKNGGTTVATLVVGTDIAIGGTATVNNVTLPADGELLTVTAEIADAVGNPGASASDTATIDLTGPAATALPTVSILLDANDDGTISIAEKGMATTTSLTVGVSAAAVAGDVITVKNGGTTVATLVVGTDIAIGGTATVNNVTLPADGELLTVTAEIADAVGNPGASASDTATIDLTGPAATALPTVSILLDANDDGTISIAEKGGETTTDLTVGVANTAVAGDVITVKNGATTVATLVVGTDIVAGGTATVTGVTLPADGSLMTVTAQIADAVGNPGATATDTAKIDTTTSAGTPTVLIALDANNDGTISIAEKGAATTTSLTVGASNTAANGDVITVKNGATTVATLVVGTDIVAGGTAKVTGVTLPADGQTLTVTAQIADAVGNPGASASDTAIIDTTASAGTPTVVIVLDTNNDGKISIAEKGAATTTSLMVGVSNTAVAGDVITVENGSTTVATLVVGTDIAIGGTATVNGVTLPADGQTLTVTAQIADAVGNPGASASDTAIVDTTAPMGTPTVSILLDTNNDGTISITEKGVATTTGLTVGVSNTAVAGDVVTVKNGSTTVATLVVGTDIAIGGTATVNNVALPADGQTLTVSAQIADAAGNPGATASDFALIDTTAPNVTGTSLAINPVTTDNVLNAAESATTVAVTGTLAGVPADAPGQTLVLKINGVNYTAAITGSTWSANVLGTDLANDPDKTIDATATFTDAAGNAATVVGSKPYVVDTNGPVLTIVDNVPGTASSDVIFTFGFNEPVTGFDTSDITIGGGTKGVFTTVDSKTYTLVVTPLANSQGNITVSVGAGAAVDGAGSPSLAATATQPYDTQPPQQSVAISTYTDDVGAATGPSGSGTTTDDPTPTLNGTIASSPTGVVVGDVLRIYQSYKGGASTLVGSIALSANQTSWTYTPGTALPFGAYSYTAKLADSAGNEATASNTFNLTVDATTALTTLATDTSALVTGSYSTTDFATNTDLVTRDSTLVLTGTMRELQTGERVMLSLDGGTTWTEVANVVGATSWTYTPAAYATTTKIAAQTRIENTVNLTNGTVTTTNFTVDLTAPVLTLTRPDFSNAASIDPDGDKTIVAGTATFNSAVDGTSEAGASVALVNDINRDGIYTEGVDTVLGSAIVAANGSWTISAALTATVGDYKLGYVVWDAAGNRTRMSATSEVDVVITLDHLDAAAAGFGTTGGAATGSSMAINSSGNWTFATDRLVATGTGSASYTTATLGLTTATAYSFADFNLNGNIDIVGATSTGALNTPIWSGTGITATPFTAGTTTFIGTANNGGVAMIDMDGDGYLDAVIGDSGGDSATFLKSNVTLGVQSFSAYGAGSTLLSTSTDPGIRALATGREVSGVDLNNDGFVDLALHTTTVTSTAINGNDNNFALTILSNNGSSSGSGANWSVKQTLADVFDIDASTVNATDAISLTWADFDNDGDLDLYVNSSNTGTTTSNSKIYTSNKGELTSNGITIANDALQGDASVAVDWTGDGKMDAIELDYASGAVRLYTNSGTIAAGGWATTALAALNANAINGVAAADYDWDGDIDLLVGITDTAATQLITNTNQVKDGTSLHLRIVNAEGHNVYYGNTVQIINSASKVVSTQIINPQSGAWVNDGSGIVNVFGLDPTDTYTVQMIANNGGVATTYSWGVKPGDATSAQVLTTTGVTNASATTLLGTGYDDNYVVTTVLVGSSTSFNGGGGWNAAVVGGSSKTLSATAGMDVVDYQLATSAVTANLTSGAVSGFGTLATVSNVEGVRGGSGADTFTGSAANNLFEGRGGNDTINLGGTGGGNDRLVYNVINPVDKVTGGNGSDTVSGFVVGDLAVGTNTNADIIDLGNLLTAYTGTNYVYRDATTNQFVLDSASAGLLNYVNVSASGGNTVVSVDMTGAGSFTTPLLTLTGVTTTLADLLANGQLLAGSSTALSIHINVQQTTDTTPLVTGTLPLGLQSGQELQVTINGVVYSTASNTNNLVVDPANNTWYVQVPASNALALGTYEVSAVVKDTLGSVVIEDATARELTVNAAPVVTVGAGGGDPNQKATAVTLSEDGVWRIHTNQTMLDATGTSTSTLGDFSTTALVSNTGTGYDGSNYVQNATFMDYNRDGLMDLFAIDSSYEDGQQMFYYNGTSYAAYQVGAFTSSPQTGAFAGDANTAGSANSWSWYGGIVAIDKNGDGLVDLVNGDQTPNDSAIRGGYGSQIILNNDGTVFGMSKDGNFATDYVADSTHQPIGLDQSQPDMELSGVDLNNDGIVDIVMHSQNIVADGSRVTATSALSTDEARLVVVSGTNSGTWNVTQVVEDVFQRGTDSDPNIGNGVAMTWADFNGDGYMDLFLGRGSESTTVASDASNSTAEYASRIYFNDGTGKLIFTDANSDGIGNPTAAGMYTFTDTVAGGASIALDWNHDGKMDVIELPGMYSSTAGNAGGVTLAAQTGPINLYTNTTVGSTVGFATTNLLTQVGGTTIGTSANPVTGAIAVDIDWDGDRDLLAFTSNGTTTYIANNNAVATGTSIHLRILDAGGINSLYGNTVQLIDQATGLVVSTQVINSQSGNQTNDSTGLVDFYNLDASKSYSAVILRSSGGAVADVGGVATAGSNTVEIVNSAWADLKATEADSAYVLTTESATKVANASSNGGTNTTGIVGTGYNDAFFATLGNDLYNGGGGTVSVSGAKAWNDTGGIDIVDYKLAGSAALTIDLSNTGAQNTGFGTATFLNIEGLAGGAGNDTFTGSTGDNQFEGRGGNDTFNLANSSTLGGHDTLLYKVLAGAAANGTGGNGSDVVNGFKVGVFESTANADRIDIKALLTGYTADADGAAHYVNGVATIDAGELITNYVSVSASGGNTVVSIDRDGTGSAFSSTQLLTLNGVSTDLATLLANHQITLV